MARDSHAGTGTEARGEGLTTMYKELAYRENNGVVVTLWLNSSFNQLRVTVHDERTGDLFALDAEADNALDVFQHPFAYASRQVRPPDEACVAAGES